ncbi:diamine N-acetyltransferase [Paenibacillus uliginis N3/975]|uniref:Diamine N-acetyltransferase n=2 Tax=Paenibacillus TaxID=44249 RepID=A0A1X7H5L0_9BACL|nr:diamine N-acetyltransferase [Paenibacillus uliginis N3/975]
MKMIDLKLITDENKEECLLLRPQKFQERFVASNANSLKKAEQEPTSRPYGIYAENVMVGFALFDEELYPDDGYFWICRFMIDERYQRKGYGRAALGEILRKMKSHPTCTKIRISHVPDNSVVNHLYKQFGFVETGEEIDGETVLDLMV